MEGTASTEISPAPVEGTWHAWTPDSRCVCGFCGTEAHADTEGELAAKLDG